MNTDGIDVDWVRERLSEFIQQTRPTRSPGAFSSRTPPQCGRDEALSLAETIRPIFEKLYPEWHSENSGSQFDEFKRERDAAKKLIARLDTQEEVVERLGGADTSPRISAASLHPMIWKAAEAQWSTDHRHEAVLAAAKAVNSHLQTKVNRRDISEADLVRQSFSEKDPVPGQPRLRFTAIVDDQTRDSMRKGVSDFGAGCFSAIRNPIGHRPNEEVELDEQTALERLAALSLFARWVDEADVVERITA